MANIIKPTIKKLNSDELFIDDDLWVSLMSKGKGEKFTSEKGIILTNNTAFNWLCDKIGMKLKLLTDEQLTGVLLKFFLKYGEHHVCPKCENLLLSHHETRKCKHCDHEVKETKSIINFLTDGDYK